MISFAILSFNGLNLKDMLIRMSVKSSTSRISYKLFKISCQF